MNRTIISIAALLLSSGLCAQEELFSQSGEFTEGGDASAHRYEIPVKAGSTVEVIVIGEDVDTVVNATLPSGETILNDDYQGVDAGFVRTISEDGVVEVIASPLMGGTGTYRVVARSVPSPDTIEVGQTVHGTLEEGSSAGDRYRLSGSAGTRVIIDLKSYDFDAYLTVVDDEGNEMTDDDGGDEGYNSRLHYQFDEDGETITITAGALSSSDGRYELVVSELSNDIAAQHSGRLDDESPRAYDGKRYAAHEFVGKAGDTLTVELDSNDFDAMLYVSNPDGSNLTQDDDGGDGTDSLAVTTLPADGAYTIYVTSLSDNTGSYELTVYR